jgi:chaperonin GroES
MNKINFKPLSNRVVLDIIKENKSPGGLIIPESAKPGTSLKGIIVAVSEEEVDNKPLIQNVKIGDEVLFDIYAGQVIDVDNKQYIIMRETEIFGILVKTVIKMVN